MLVALTPVIEVLESLGVAYHLGGSVASSVWGVARATNDVDVVAGIHDLLERALAEASAR
ncbi:MAG: hypothetical protein IPK26_27915 [Planctomycetes bacterium]|nr:hypothetical protein [Planctomycetota bacterium]